MSLIRFTYAPDWNFSENTFLDFGSIGDFACTPIESEDETPKKPWQRSVIKNTNVFSVRIGPSGGRKGFSAITSLVYFLTYFNLFFSLVI